MIQRETDVLLIGYGSMMLESFVAVMALIAAPLDPASSSHHSPVGIVGTTAEVGATISAWDFPVTVEQ